MISPMILHPMQLVAASISSVEEMMQHPLALPVAVGAVTVFLTILLFYNISESLRKQNDAGMGGESAVRRSSRYVLWLDLVSCDVGVILTYVSTIVYSDLPKEGSNRLILLLQWEKNPRRRK